MLFRSPTTLPDSTALVEATIRVLDARTFTAPGRAAGTLEDSAVVRVRLEP